MSRRVLLLASILCLALLACGQPSPPRPASADGTPDPPPPAASREARTCPAASADAGLPARIGSLLEQADAIGPLKAVVVAHEGAVIAERGYHGSGPGSPANIKSASKTVISALVGIAIDKGVLEGVDQPVAPLLQTDLPQDPDPRLQQLAIGHLLSMQAGLERTSGPYY